MNRLAKKCVSLVAVFGLFPLVAMADQQSLQDERTAVVSHYMDYLGQANGPALTALFVPGGKVVSTSQGEKDAASFFGSFLGDVATAKVSTGGIGKSFNDPDQYAARFHFSWVMKDGTSGEGEYMDEFVFQPNSPLLEIVYMFENPSL